MSSIKNHTGLNIGLYRAENFLKTINIQFKMGIKFSMAMQSIKGSLLPLYISCVRIGCFCQQLRLNYDYLAEIASHQ